MVVGRYEGALNLREIGGLPTTDGRRLRSGMLFRSGTPQLMSEHVAHALVSDLGIRTVADLRSPAEARTEGSGGLEGAPHRRLALPFLVASSQQEGSSVPRFAAEDPLVPHYLAYLDSSAASVVSLFRALAEPGGAPLLVHCTAGKDRTGAAVMLLLDALGVERSAIVADYAAGADEIAAVFDTLIALPSYGARLAALPAEVRATTPETAERYLQQLDDRFGGVNAWLREAGLRDEELDAVRLQLTEPV